MTRKQIGQNAGNSGRISLSGPELDKFDTVVEDLVKIDIAESKRVARAMVDNSDHERFVNVSEPESTGESR